MAGLRRSRVDRLREIRPAPGELRLLQAFINTADLEVGTDELSSGQRLSEWLEPHRLLAPGTELDRADVQRAIEFRESLRKLVAAGESASRELGQAVDRALVTAPVRSRFDAGDVLRFQPAGGAWEELSGASWRSSTTPSAKATGRASSFAFIVTPPSTEAVEVGDAVGDPHRLSFYHIAQRVEKATKGGERLRCHPTRLEFRLRWTKVPPNSVATIRASPSTSSG